VSGIVLSKPKIIKLVNDGHVRGWDDPRLYTLPALRRRGGPPRAILSFINELRVTKATTVISIKRFEHFVRKYLEETVPRLMLVLDPVKVIIDNLPEDRLAMLEVPFSKDPVYGVSIALRLRHTREKKRPRTDAIFLWVHSVPFTKTVFIETNDFREINGSDYFRLAPGKTVDC